MPYKKITFEEFWEKYPLHKAKQDAEKVWKRLSAKDQRAAFNGIDRYKEYLQRTGISIKYAHGWLNGRRWEDEYEEPDEKPSGTVAEPAGTVTETKVEAVAPERMEKW